MKPLPIVCTLTPSELRDRGTAWAKLLGSGLVERTRIPGGVRLAPEPGARVALVDLVELERACCLWMDIEIGEAAVVTITADSADGEAVIAQAFLPAGA